MQTACTLYNLVQNYILHKCGHLLIHRKTKCTSCLRYFQVTTKTCNCAHATKFPPLWAARPHPKTQCAHLTQTRTHTMDCNLRAFGAEELLCSREKLLCSHSRKCARARDRRRTRHKPSSGARNNAYCFASRGDEFTQLHLIISTKTNS